MMHLILLVLIAGFTFFVASRTMLLLNPRLYIRYDLLKYGPRLHTRDHLVLMAKVLASEIIQRDPEAFLNCYEIANETAKVLRSAGEDKAFLHYRFITRTGISNFDDYNIYRLLRLVELADVNRVYDVGNLTYKLSQLLLLLDIISFFLPKLGVGTGISDGDVSLARSLVKKRKDTELLNKMAVADRMYRSAYGANHCDVEFIYIDDFVIEDLSDSSEMIKFVTFLDDLDYGIIKYYKSDQGKLFGEYYRSNRDRHIGELLSFQAGV